MMGDAPWHQPVPLHMEFDLSFLIRRAGVRQPSPARRLNAFENLLWLMADRFRSRQLIVPSRDVRMSERTRESLLAWVQEKEQATSNAARRLSAYASGATDVQVVPDGRIRLLLPQKVRFPN